MYLFLRSQFLWLVRDVMEVHGRELAFADGACSALIPPMMYALFAVLVTADSQNAVLERTLADDAYLWAALSARLIS